MTLMRRKEKTCCQNLNWWRNWNHILTLSSYWDVSLNLVNEIGKIRYKNSSEIYCHQILWVLGQIKRSRACSWASIQLSNHNVISIKQDKKYLLFTWNLLWTGCIHRGLMNLSWCFRMTFASTKFCMIVFDPKCDEIITDFYDYLLCIMICTKK